MSEFSKKSALVSQGFIGIKHDADPPPRPVMDGMGLRGWAGLLHCLSFTISLPLVLMKSVTEACNKAFQPIAKEISRHVNFNLEKGTFEWV